MPKPPDQLNSTQLKIPVKQLLESVDKIIQRGEAAVKGSDAALQANPGNVQLAANHRQNQELLAKAEYIKDALEMSEKVANMMCPQQVAMLDFDFVD